MDSCSLEISDMKEVVHFRFVVGGKDSPREIIELENDLSISVPFKITKSFGVHPSYFLGGITEPIKVPKER